MITRRQFLKGLVGAGVGAALVRFAVTNTSFHKSCHIRHIRTNLAPGWRGRTVLFISDIHFGQRFGETEAAALATVVRSQSPDLILMGGDLADTPTTDLDGFFSQWIRDVPTLFSPGNHDLAPRGMRETVLPQAVKAGFRVLDNAAETLDGLRLVGLPSILRRSPNLSLLDSNLPTLLLWHEPDAWDFCARPNILELAGHTHGGQIRILNRPLVLPTFGRKYVLGDYSKGAGRTLVVTAGVGCIKPAVRINCPPEIVKLEFS